MMITGMRICGFCGRKVPEEKMCEVDGTLICARCMYGDVKPFEIYPIGVVKNDLQRSSRDFGVVGNRGDISRIELIASQKPFLYRLEDEKRLTIVYYLHQARPVRSVFQRGLDKKKVGVFASRTPDRLSRIGIQNVELVSLKNTTLRVKGLDAVDGTPVLDIKLALP